MFQEIAEFQNGICEGDFEVLGALHKAKNKEHNTGE